MNSKINDEILLCQLHSGFFVNVILNITNTLQLLPLFSHSLISCFPRVTCLSPEAVLLNRMFGAKNAIALHTSLVMPRSLRRAETVSPQAAFGTSTKNHLKENGWNCQHHMLHWGKEISVSKDNCFSHCSHFFLQSPHLFSCIYSIFDPLGDIFKGFFFKSKWKMRFRIQKSIYSMSVSFPWMYVFLINQPFWGLFICSLVS